MGIDDPEATPTIMMQGVRLQIRCVLEHVRCVFQGFHVYIESLHDIACRV